MGRIKTRVIKRLTRDIMELYEDRLTDDFEKNKEAIISLTGLTSKKLRNIVAGYATRLIKFKKAKEI